MELMIHLYTKRPMIKYERKNKIFVVVLCCGVQVTQSSRFFQAVVQKPVRWCRWFSSLTRKTHLHFMFCKSWRGDNGVCLVPRICFSCFQIYNSLICVHYWLLTIDLLRGAWVIQCNMFLWNAHFKGTWNYESM